MRIVSIITLDLGEMFDARLITWSNMLVVKKTRLWNTTDFKHKSWNTPIQHSPLLIDKENQNKKNMYRLYRFNMIQLSFSKSPICTFFPIPTISMDFSSCTVHLNREGKSRKDMTTGRPDAEVPWWLRFSADMADIVAGLGEDIFMDLHGCSWILDGCWCDFGDALWSHVWFDDSDEVPTLEGWSCWRHMTKICRSWIHVSLHLEISGMNVNVLSVFLQLQIYLIYLILLCIKIP